MLMGKKSKFRTQIYRFGILILLVLFLVLTWPLVQERFFPAIQFPDSGQALPLTESVTCFTFEVTSLDILASKMFESSALADLMDSGFLQRPAR